MSQTPTALAATLLAQNKAAAAMTLMAAAVRAGDGEAMYELARWHVFGHPVRRDFSVARDLFRRAGLAHHRAAALTHAVFVAIGAGGPSDWTDAMRLLGRAAQDDPVAAKQLQLLASMALDADGRPRDPASSRQLAAQPVVAISPGLFTPDECAHIVQLAQPFLIPSIVVDPATGRQIPHPVRTSSGAVLGPLQMDMVVEALNRRIAAVTGTRAEQGEPLTVLHYRPGQQYRLHHDCLPGEPNQRVTTLIAYLNDSYTGGGTRFAALDTAVQGRIGDAVHFANTGPDGGVDQRSRHAGMPVLTGEKWVCTRWIRARDFDPWGMRQR